MGRLTESEELELLELEALENQQQPQQSTRGLNMKASKAGGSTLSTGSISTTSAERSPSIWICTLLPPPA